MGLKDYLFMGSKKEKQKQETALPNAVNQAIKEEKEKQETQKELDENRKLKEQIKQGFADLRLPDVAQKSRKAAAENEAKLNRLWKAVQRMQPGEGDESDAKMSKLWDMEKDVFIVPGGYSENPTEENGIPKTNLDVYNRAIESLARGYQAKTAVDAVQYGANELDGFVVNFLGNLRSAIESGRAMKANACIDMIKYVLVVGYRYEDASDPEDFKKRIQKKVDFIQNIGKHLIENVDYYYTLLTQYELEEERYAQVTGEYDRVVEPYINECPPDVHEKLNRLGFKRSMRELPAGDDARKYLGIMLAAESYLTRAIMSSLRLEAFSMEILRERANLQELVHECKKAYLLSGDEFNFEEHSRVIETIQRRNIDEINTLNDMAARESEHNTRMRSLLKEAAENEKLAFQIGQAQRAIDNYNNLRKRNQKLKHNESVTRIENEKRNAVLKQEEEARIQQQKEELERIKEREAPQVNDQLILDEM